MVGLSKTAWALLFGAVVILSLLFGDSIDKPTTETKLLSYVHGLGNSYPESDVEIISMSYSVCDSLDKGMLVDDVPAYLFPEYNSGQKIEFVFVVITGAVENLCPEYTSQLKE